MDELGDDGVAEGLDPSPPLVLVHPIGNPISHSEHSGVNGLPNLFRNQRSRDTALFVPKQRAFAFSVCVQRRSMWSDAVGVGIE